MSARCSSKSPRRARRRSTPAASQATAQADAQMTGLLGRLFAVAEAYPELKANTNFLQLQDQLASIEGELQSARRYYNATVRDLNSTHPELPAGADRAADGLHRRAVLPGRRSGDPKRPEGILPPPGGLIMRSAWSALPALLIVAAPAHADERILRYLSDVQVQQDSSLEVTETIDVQAENDRINHGIYRDFPTRYRGPARRLRSESASPSKARRSTDRRSRQAPKPVGNGVRIKVGDPNKIVDVGEHSYVLHYRATRADRPLQRTMTSSTGTRPATAGSSRSMSPRRASACPRRASFGQRSAYTGAARVDRVQRRGGRRTARRHPVPDHAAARRL